MLIDARKIGMSQHCQQQRLTLKSGRSFSDLLWSQTMLTHFLDGNDTVSEVCILCFIDSTKATLPNALDKTIALFEQMVGDMLSCVGRRGNGGDSIIR